MDARRRQALSAWLVLALGALVLVVGWWLGVEPVQRVMPTLESMKANTALGLVLLGVALLPWSGERPHVRSTAAALLLLLGLATGAQYVFDVDLGIDQLLATDTASTGGGPGRPGLNTATCLALLAVALLLVPRTAADRHAEVRAGVAQVATVTAGLLALLALMSYVFGAVVSPGISSATEMALHTSVGILVGAIGTVEATASAGPLRPLRSSTTVGGMTRVLLVLTVAGLVVLGAFVGWLGRADIVVAEELQLALLSTLGVGVVTVVVMVVSRRLDTSAVEVERSRQELLALNSQLEARVKARTAELADVVADLERSNDELEQFAYVASHDLQEPLRMVTSFVQRIEDRYGDQLDDRGHEYVRLAVDGARRMSDLIDALLRYARVGRAELDLRLVDVGELLREVLATFEEIIDRDGATVHVEPPMPHLMADPTLLRQALQNVIGNALKFTRPGVPAVVRVRAERDADHWRVEVVDEGVGIDPRFRDDVFGAFRRVHPRQAYAGAGVGLAITERIVSRHDGSIAVGDPTTGGYGTRMVLSIPVGSQEQT